MEMHNPIALKKGDRIVIGGYDRPKPNREDYIIGTSPSGLNPVYDEHLFKTHLLEWLQSYKEYAVREADEKEIETYLYATSKISLLAEFKQALSTGIPCDELIPRLMLIPPKPCPYEDCKDIFKSKCRFPDKCTNESFWTLKPVDVVETNGRGQEIRNIVDMQDSLVQYPHGNEHCILPEHYDQLSKDVFKHMINFTTWYSGMDKSKVEKAYLRYLNEISLNI